MKPINLKRLVISLLIPLLVGGLAALLSGGFDTYGSLNQPPLSPPPIVFPIVWTILYIMMGIAAYLVTDFPHRETNEAMKYYYLQLGLNFLWPIVFFRMSLFTPAAIILGAMIVLIFITMMKFREISKPAFYLLIPYFLWCCFALYLNIGVAVLN